LNVSQPLRVYADADRLNLAGPGGKSYGNKLLHFFFMINMAACQNRSPMVPVSNDLTDLFELADDRFGSFQLPEDYSGSYVYSEKSCFGPQSHANVFGAKARYMFYGAAEQEISECVVKSENQYKSGAELLHRELPRQNVVINGHFFHYELMPTQFILKQYIKLRDDTSGFLITKYPDLLSPTAVAVHHRGGDFRRHLRGVFRNGIVLDDDYYRQAALLAAENKGCAPVFHLFSDEMPLLTRAFRGYSTVIHDDPPNVDWSAMFLMKNIIGCSSSFSWTASLYNKDLVIQPEGGYNYYHSGLGSVPYGFKMPGSCSIGVK